MAARRDFIKTTVLGAAGLGLGATTARAQSRVAGANDRVVLAVVGIRGQGNALKRGFARLKGVEIKTLCDVDENLFAERANDEKLKDVAGFRPRYEKDMRRVFEDKDIDAVLVATPNHWHALATIWGLQAGKHVFVEKPSSHTVWEGRQMVEAQKKYKKLVQVGTMNRSRPPVIAAIKFMQEGGLGRLYMARGLCYKPRPSIGKYPDGPVAPGEKYRLNLESKEYEPTWDSAYLSKVDYDLWTGPAPARTFNRNRFHYNWHWHWDTGNGDTGNQGPHQFDIARWGLGITTHPVRVSSTGGLYEKGETSQETPNVHTTLFDYEDGRVIEFATRGTITDAEGSQRIGNLFFGTEGWLYIDGDGREWQSYLGRKEEKGPGASVPKGEGGGSDPNVLTSIEYPHYQNFIDAIRAGDEKKLNCDVLEGHMSSTLPHLANIAYRLKRQIRFDGKTETVPGDAEANRLLTREYREAFRVPERV